VGRLIGGRDLPSQCRSGVIGAIGSFGALMLSFTRLPGVMAEDGYLPKGSCGAARRPSPWVAVLPALSSGLCVTRWVSKEPDPRCAADRSQQFCSSLAPGRASCSRTESFASYRVPGGLFGTIVLGLPPLALIIAALCATGPSWWATRTNSQSAPRSLPLESRVLLSADRPGRKHQHVQSGS